ncbi:hypothetical protein G3A_14810 [Bacillus sp. 17376]|nr:hypothetical protein G3A_14810 [Bacillus sp. 17376]
MAALPIFREGILSNRKNTLMDMKSERRMVKVKEAIQ